MPAFLNPMKFQKIRNLGGKFGETVKTETNSELVSDLLQYSLTDLQTKFGEENGEFVWSIVRGLSEFELLFF